MSNQRMLFNLRSTVGLLGLVLGFVASGALPAHAQVAVPSAHLAWAPPALTSPTTITITSDIIRSRGVNGHKWFLDVTKDYEIKIGKVNTSYGVVISGGRNVVIKGGYITIPWAGTYPDNAAAYKDMAKRRALLVANQTGTVHIEGLRIDNALGDLSEGIQIQSPNADVQIENVRITGVHARDQVAYTDNHPDCVQPIGVKAMRVDRFTCSSDAQAFFLDNGSARPGQRRHPSHQRLGHRQQLPLPVPPGATGPDLPGEAHGLLGPPPARATPSSIRSPTCSSWAASTRASTRPA